MDAVSNPVLSTALPLRGPRKDRGRTAVSRTQASLPSVAPRADGAARGGDQGLRERIAELVALNRELQEALERQRQISEALRGTPGRPAADPAVALCCQDAAARAATLTARQRQIMDLVLAGHPSKNIAADLGLNQRTVENHRAAIMKKMGAASLAALVRIGLAAA
jgi:DNA-binding NarL/FixJ family response regulator